MLSTYRWLGLWWLFPPAWACRGLLFFLQHQVPPLRSSSPSFLSSFSANSQKCSPWFRCSKLSVAVILILKSVPTSVLSPVGWVYEEGWKETERQAFESHIRGRFCSPAQHSHHHRAKGMLISAMTLGDSTICLCPTVMCIFPLSNKWLFKKKKYKPSSKCIMSYIAAINRFTFNKTTKQHKKKKKLN